MDIRVSRTQKMLLDAFEELISEKTMEDISVSEICERSTVRRNTFYRHFSDKYTFIEFYLQSLTTRFMAEAQPESDLKEIDVYAGHMHRALITFIETHQQSARSTIGQTALMSTIDMVIVQISEGITLRLARDFDEKKCHPAMPAEFLGIFYSAGMVHTLRWWLFNGKPVSAEQLERHCTEFLMRCHESLCPASSTKVIEIQNVAG